MRAYRHHRRGAHHREHGHPGTAQSPQPHAFILDATGPLQRAHDIPGYTIEHLDRQRLEVEVTNEQSLTDLFAALGERGITVVSMRNKANRLEELFLRLVETGSADAAHETRPQPESESESESA